MISGARAMVRSLLEEGVGTVFGYPGAAIAPFYDELGASGIRHVLTRTEEGAGHAANGYARVTGRPGVCAATSGPGAINLLTAIATAYSDSIPMVAITGQVPSAQLGRDMFQEADTTGAAESFTKHAYLLKSADDIGRVFREAFHIASTGRRGPVLIDVPIDVQKSGTDFKYPDSVALRGYKPTSAGHPVQVRKVAEAVRAARRPLICLGGGVYLAGAEGIVREFCGRTGIPSVSTMMGTGLFLPGHPLHYGMVGQSGFRTANAAVGESDLLILIGARVSDRAITRPANLEGGTTIVHIDVDPAEIGKNLSTTIPLVGDIAEIIPELAKHDCGGNRDGWTARLDAMRADEEKAALEKRAAEGFVEPNAFVRMLCGKLPPGSIYVADVGQNQIWSAKNYRADGRFMTTGGMGTMGYSIPAAIGAKLACPDRTVIAVCGDGAFQMSMNELGTMRQQGADVKIVVLQNGVLGMVREIQKKAYGGREVAVDLSGSPDFGLIAKAYGMDCFLARGDDEAERAAEAVLAAEGPALLVCAVDPKEETT